MRIVIFGLALSSSWGNGHATTYRSLIKGLAAGGHHVTFFERDVPWYADNRDAARFEYCTLHLYDSLDGLQREHRQVVSQADAVIVGSYVPEGPLLIHWLQQVVRGRLCFYDIDTPVTLQALAHGDSEYLKRSQVPGFDIYFSFAGGRALEALADLGARLALPLYCSVDTELYRPLAPLPAGRRWRLGYMGTFAPDRQPAVDRLLLDAARRAPELRFVVAGPGYPATTDWPANVDWLSHVEPAQHPRFYADQDFTLNATRAAMVELGSSPSVRLFEAAACGCCIVSDAWPGLESVFEPGREVLVVENTAQVLAILADVNDAQRRALAEAARRRVLAEHSHRRRAEYLVDCLQDVREFRRVAT